jgi:HK97 family phage major capsid protein
VITLADIEPLKTLDEYATLLNETQARMKDIDTEHGVAPLPEEAQAEWAGLEEVEEELRKRIAEKKARAARLEKFAKDERTHESAFTGRTVVTNKARRVPEDIFALEQYRSLSTSEPELMQAYHDGAMYAVDRAIYPHPNSKTDVEQEHIEKLLTYADEPSPHNPNRELARRIIATGSNTYLRAFTKYLQGRPLNPDEQRAAAPLTVQTDATGGYAVPFYFDPTLLHTGAWTNINPYRQACAVKTIVGTDTYNGATTAAVTIARAAEAAAAVEGGGAVGQVSAIVGKVHGFVTVSMELLQDRPDIVSELASLISEAKDTEEESIFTVGVGDALGQGYNPIGMIPATGTSGIFTEVTTATSNTLAAADLYSVEAGVPIRHRANAAWFMGRATIRSCQALETSGGQLFGGVNYAATPYPQVSPVGNTGLRLLNYPIWETPSATTGLGNSANVAALVNPSQYYIIERAGMTVETVPHVFADAAGSRPTGERGIYAWWRNTAKPANSDGGRILQILTA